MNQHPRLTANDIRKSYGQSFTLAVDSLHSSADEIVCILGPNGAGKSTLLRLMAGVESADSGRVEFDGNPLRDKSPLVMRRRLTMVFQRPIMLTGDVRANIEYGMRLRGESKANRRSMTDSLMDRFRIAHLAKQTAKTLSGGQMQLVTIARALAIGPDVLLLDEPTANLDPAHTALVERVISEIRQERPTSIVWATHNLFQARRVAGRVALLWDGELVECLPTEQFFDSPVDPRTGDFIKGKIIY